MDNLSPHVRSLSLGEYEHHWVDCGQGPTLLLIHGSLCDWRYWRWQIPALQQHYRVLAPSLRHYWPNQHDATPFSAQQHALDLYQLLEQLSLPGPLHVLGHSRGGHVALELCRLKPAQLQHVILADPGFPTGQSYSYQSLFEQVGARLLAGQKEQALELFVDTVNGAGTWKQMTRWFKQMVYDNAATLLLQQAEPRARPDFSFLSSTEAKLHLITGSDSPDRYAHCMQLIREHAAIASEHVIPLAAHGMNLANPKAFNLATLEALDTN